MTEKLNRSEWTARIDPFVAEIKVEVTRTVRPTKYGPSANARKRLGICDEGTGTKVWWGLKLTYRGEDITEWADDFGVWEDWHETRKSALAVDVAGAFRKALVDSYWDYTDERSELHRIYELLVAG